MWVVEDSDVAKLLPPRPRDAHKWQSAVAVVAGSPGMTGAAGLCARAAYRAGAGMVRLGIPGGDPADLPVSEAVGAPLGGGRMGPPPRSPWPSGARRWWSVPGSVGPRPPWPTCVTSSAGRRCPSSSTPTASMRWARATRSPPRWAPSPGPARRPGARAVLTPHEGEFARLAGAAPGPDRIAPPGAGPTGWRGGAAQRTDDRCRRPGRGRAAGHGGLAPARHGRHRGRAVGRHRGVRRPRGRAAPRRRPRRPRPRARRRAGPFGGTGGGGPRRSSGPMAVGGPPA